MMNIKKYIAIGLMVVVMLNLTACGSKEEKEESDPISVEVMTPGNGEVEVQTEYIGTVTPQEQVYVIPKASGTVTETYFKVGDTVTEGDVLFKIDDSTAQLQLNSAQAAYNSAEAAAAAQSGGARDLQNYQTEQQIDALEETVENAEDSISEQKEALKKLKSQDETLQSNLTGAQAALGIAQGNYNALLGERDTINQQLDDPTVTDKDELKDKLSRINDQLTTAEKAVTKAEETVGKAQSAVKENETAKAQIQSSISQLESSKKTARSSLETAKGAYSITKNEVYADTDAASAAQLEAQGAGIDAAELQVEYCTVKTPISGVVEAVNVEKNGMAAAGSPAYTISNKDSMTVTFNVTENAKNALAEGNYVIVERNGKEYDGRITEVGTMANEVSKLFTVKALVSNAGNSLPNGVSVKVRATTKKDTDKLVIPYDEIYFSAGNAYVYCVTDDNTLVRQEVTVGLMNDTEAVIEEGLTEKSRVVKNWSSKLRDGAEVEVTAVNGKAVEGAE